MAKSYTVDELVEVYQKDKDEYFRVSQALVKTGKREDIALFADASVKVAKLEGKIHDLDKDVNYHWFENNGKQYPVVGISGEGFRPLNLGLGKCKAIKFLLEQEGNIDAVITELQSMQASNTQ